MTTYEAIEQRWLAAHPEISEKYAGKFIAIVGQKIIAHGKHELEVIKTAEKVSKDYVIAYFYPPEEMII
jgi:hypothetical protein